MRKGFGGDFMLIKKLTDLNGLPGNEGEVREFIKNEIKDHVDELYTDRLGSLIAVKNKNAEGRHIGYAAHMDEVGLIVTWIDNDGYLKFESWGVDPRIFPSKIVKIGKNKVTGVIGTKAIHLQEPTERTKALPVDKLYIDIGAKSKEEAEKLVSLGDFVAFDSEFVEFGDHKIKAKALDDRVGCAMLIEMLKSDYPYKMTAVFNVQEEVGLRGSAVTSKLIDCDLILNIEGTVSADMPGLKPHQTVNTQGNGPSISLIDNASIYLRKYVDAMTKVAEAHNIPCQFRRTQNGGTDAGQYHTGKTGTPVIGLAVPCRYIHSPVSVMDKRDYDNLLKLMKAFSEEYCGEKIL
jgi:endoglucanase